MLTLIGREVGDNWESWKDKPALRGLRRRGDDRARRDLALHPLAARARAGHGRARRRCAALKRSRSGLLHGPVELLPVSSSGHVGRGAVAARLGGEPEDGARRKELEVALHAGTALALLRPFHVKRSGARGRRCSPPACSRRRSRGCCSQAPIEARLGTPGTLAAGLLAGAAALALADRAPDGAATRRTRTGATASGSASRSARRSGRASRAAARRSRRRGRAGSIAARRVAAVVGGRPARARRRGACASGRGGSAAGGARPAFASTLATARAVGLERRRPLWPWAAWRAVLAAAVLVVRQNRARD